jgi:hypothetical protein
VQLHPDPASDQPDRYRVAVGAHTDLAVTVHPGGEPPAGLERLGR